MNVASEHWGRWVAALQDMRLPFSIALHGMERFNAWDVGSRVLPEHMVHYVFAGSQIGRVDGQSVRTVPGSLLLVPAGTPQELRMDHAQGRLGLFFFRFTIGTSAKLPAPPFLRHGMTAMHALALQIDHEASTDLPGRESRLRALLTLVFTDCWRALPHQLVAFTAEQRRRLLELVDRSMADRIDPKSLAREFDMSPTWFSRQFRRTFGTSPRSWLVQYRIHLAAQRLVSTEEAIGDIAEHFGYADIFLFSRQFRQIMGKSPTHWRRIGESTLG